MNQRNQGFTLIEVVVSLGLLIMIIGLLPMVTIIQNSNTYSSGSTAMTNIAMSLVERLNMQSFTELGSDNWSDCKDAGGHAQRGTSQGVCIEGPLNQLGQTETYNTYLNMSDDFLYRFYRFSVVCSNTLNLPGGYSGTRCPFPSNNAVGGPVSNELSCSAANYSNSTKEIKVLVAYTDKYGKCKKQLLRSWKVSY